jgi:hypothetical protein
MRDEVEECLTIKQASAVHQRNDAQQMEIV